jgi:hypothetical protein
MPTELYTLNTLKSRHTKFAQSLQSDHYAKIRAGSKIHNFRNKFLLVPACSVGGGGGGGTP